MICKHVNYKLAIEEWNNLLRSQKLTKSRKRFVENQLKGIRAEQDVGYHLGLRFQSNPDFAVFNNIKILHGEYSAQIDHLVLTRWSAYFIETKYVKKRLNINADGQFARRDRPGRYHNIESPIEQNRRHEQVLFDLLHYRRSDFMGTFLGMQKTFRNLIDVQHLVAVPVGTLVGGRGKRNFKHQIQPADQLPEVIFQRHKAVKSGFLEGLLADALSPGHEKRLPAFNETEFQACCDMLLGADTAQTPLEQVHEFIKQLPERSAVPAGQPQTAAGPGGKRMPPPPPIKRRAETQPAIAPSAATIEPTVSADAPAPDCPVCGRQMTLRTARRGKNTGRQFYGCPAFPKCRGIVNVE
ncbi:MAG: NERD domain-containing protein [Phycisphaerae bacterium]